MAQETEKKSVVSKILRLVVFGAFVLALVLFFALGGADYVSLESLRDNRAFLTQFVQESYLIAALCFIVAYFLVAAFSLPLGLLLSLTGGFLFGAIWGGFFIVVGATLGATSLFLAAKYVFREALSRSAGVYLQKLEAGFQENALSYMFVLRLVPIFPFWVVNLVPALLGVRGQVFFVGTFFGIMPGSFAYALAGAGIGSVFDQGGELSASNILTPQLLGAFVALGLVALMPVVYKQIRKRKRDHHA